MALFVAVAFVAHGRLPLAHLWLGTAGWLVTTLASAYLVLSTLVRSRSVTLNAAASVAPLLIAGVLLLIAVFAGSYHCGLALGLTFLVVPALRTAARRGWQRADLNQLRPVSAGVRPAQ